MCNFTHMKQPEIDAIKARLAAAPGLPWAVDRTCQQIYSPSTGNYIGTEGDESDPEIAFMIHAGTDLADLLAYVEELRRRLDTQQMELAEQEREKLVLVQENQKLAADLDRAGQSGVCIRQLALNGTIDEFRQAEMMEALSSEEWHEFHRLPATPEPPACSQNCSSCQKGEKGGADA